MRNWLRQLRLKKRMTQQNVANKLGITQQYYSSIESGKRQKDLCSSLILGLADCFGMSPIDVVNKEKE